jgi:hypothetical protein
MIVSPCCELQKEWAVGLLGATKPDKKTRFGKT